MHQTFVQLLQATVINTTRCKHSPSLTSGDKKHFTTWLQSHKLNMKRRSALTQNRLVDLSLIFLLSSPTAWATLVWLVSYRNTKVDSVENNIYLDMAICNKWRNGHKRCVKVERKDKSRGDKIKFQMLMFLLSVWGRNLTHIKSRKLSF